MTESLDYAIIGPLSSSRIGHEPVAWGEKGDFVVADAETGAYVERQVERDRIIARGILSKEVAVLFADVRHGREPQSVLSGVLTWGPVSTVRLAGYLGRSVGEVESTVKALEGLRILRVMDSFDYGEPQYDYDPGARGLEV